MKKIFRFKCNDNATAKVEVELTNDNVFRASAMVTSKGELIMGGQCLDELKEMINDETFDTIYKMWKKHHLNDMHPGTEKQEEALTNGGYTSWANNYTECCNYLESIGLLIDNGYKFGTGWLKRDISDNDIEIIKGLLK